MSVTILEQLLLSEENLLQAKKRFRDAKTFEKSLRQQRKHGKLLYENWRRTQDWYQWREEQLERQKWQCACCGNLMTFGKKIYLANGDFTLNSDHPTIDHVLPKSYFPDLALDKQNLVIACWACNKRKGNSVVIASRLRHRQLKQLK